MKYFCESFNCFFLLLYVSLIAQLYKRVSTLVREAFKAFVKSFQGKMSALLNKSFEAFEKIFSDGIAALLIEAFEAFEKRI